MNQVRVVNTRHPKKRKLVLRRRNTTALSIFVTESTEMYRNGYVHPFYDFRCSLCTRVIITCLTDVSTHQ